MTTLTARAVLDAQITEKQFQQQVIDLARRYKWLVYHTHNSKHSAPGFPDLVMARDGELVVVELKTERGKVTAAQQAWLDAFEASPTVYVAVWRPSMFKSIERVLRP
jgi:hypothetical protein